jgi:hypothetical protein
MKRFPIFATILLALLLLPALSAGAAMRPSARPAFGKRDMPQITKRQQIVDAIKLRLAAIDSTVTLADGYKYQSDLGARPIEEWPIAQQSDDLPMIGVYDLVEKRQKDYPDQRAVEAALPLQVRVFHNREDTPATLRNMLGDVMKAIVTDPTSKKEDLTLGGLAVDIKPDENGFVVPKETFQIDGLAVGITVEHMIAPYDA